MREVMDAYSDPRVTTVVQMMASQLAKSEGGVFNPVGYFVHQDPSPVMIVEPTKNGALHNAKTRLAPMIRDTPVLRQIIGDPKSRDSDNTTLEKQFPGGSIRMVGANVAADLAGDPIRVVLFNEVARFPASAGSEGDPVTIATRRTTTFPNRKIGMNSSPTDEGDRICEAYEESDQRQLFVPCPHCGHPQTLRWEQVRWKKGARGEHLPTTARYYCEIEDCEKPWSEAQRHRAIRRASENEDDPDIGWIASKPFNGTAGFRLSGLYALWPNMSLPHLAEEWITAQGKGERVKAFINTVLGEPWKQQRVKVRGDLNERLEEYPTNHAGLVVVPKEVVLITAGFDTQDDRLEGQITGYGLNDESWKLAYYVLRGDPSAPPLWGEMWDLMLRPLPMERGGVDYIRSTCLDTQGHHAQRAYEFCRNRAVYATPDGRRAYLFGIKGRAGPAGNVFVREPTRNNIGKIPLYTINVDPAKTTLQYSLNRILEPGPGYIHFPRFPVGSIPGQRINGKMFGRLPGDLGVDLGDGTLKASDYFDQLTAEVRATRTNKAGRDEFVWMLEKEGSRNEALDTHVYGDGAYYAALSMGMDLEAERSLLERIASAPAPSVEPVPKTEPQPRQRKRRSKYLG